MDLKALGQKAKSAEAANKKLFQKLKKQKPANLDKVMLDLHEEVFAETDCLSCANCCKTTSPIFYMKDIDRLAKYFRISSGKFIEKYLHIDEDNDYVLNSSPCTFLGADNYCSVYDSRPMACREYPHTDRKRFHQILDLTMKNTLICPAVYNIVEKLKGVY
jgi:Fe-S-cluster containining protein